MARILLIDDDANLREVLSFALSEYGHQIELLPDGRGVQTALETFRPEVVITDLKMPGVDGLGVLKAATEWDAAVPVILLTAFGTIEDAVGAMKLGAWHYLTKPYNREELRVTVEQALDRRRLLLENRHLRDRLREQSRRIEIIHASEAMTQIIEMVHRVAPSDATVLITGESGTGKELVAQALHTGSERWDKPLVTVNCAAIPRDLMESELFGHARGAFTGAVRDKPGKFQRADGGTLLLDEVADLPAELQTKLLRAIETGQVDVVGGQNPVRVDVRLLAATNADLAARVRKGHFRSDLFYRLNVIPIHLPPLRERADDVPALWEHFVRRYAGEATIRSSPELIRSLMARRWPGNVRELANLARRMVLLRRSDMLDVEGLPEETPSGEAQRADVTPRTEEVQRANEAQRGDEVERADGGFAAAGRDQAGTLGGESAASTGTETSARLLPGRLPEGGLPLFELEREVIVRALARHGGNRTRTAEYLAIPRHVLLYRLEKFRIG